MPQVIR
jgi:hypothetical protein